MKSQNGYVSNYKVMVVICNADIGLLDGLTSPQQLEICQFT